MNHVWHYTVTAMEGNYDMRRHLFVIILISLLSLEILLASQMYQPQSPKALEKNVTFDLQEKATLKPHINENVENGTFQFTEQVLEISAERAQNPGAWSIFDTFVGTELPMNPDLNFKYSMMASQLNVTTDALRIYFTLINGTHAIILGYVVGLKEQDRIPDPDARQYSYVFYQVGNSTNVWFNDERNLWNDLSTKGLSMDDSWKITEIIFGIISYRGELDAGHLMKGFFNASETILFHQKITYVTLVIEDSRISWQMVTAMALIILSTLILPILARRFKIQLFR